MTSEKAFQLYFALKLHFSSDYDVFTYGTNFRGKNDVQDRNDFKLILPITKFVSTEREMIELCVANFLYGNDKFLYDPDWADVCYKKWVKNKHSLTHNLEKDISTIEAYIMKHDCRYEDYLKYQVISDLLSSKIEYESLIMINNMIPTIDNIQGFDSGKYKVRMHKASKFVNKGVLGHNHFCHIDSFKQFLKGSQNGNISISTP